MNRLWIGVMLAASCAAAEQVGTLTAAGPVKLRGAEVPGPAAQALPVASGDEIETLADAAVLAVPDGSRVTLEKASLGRAARQARETIVCLERGSLRFSVTAAARVLICALGRTVIPSAPSEGTITVVSPDKVEASAEKGTVRVDEARACSCPPGPPPGWTAKKKAVVVIVAAAGAGATAAGIAAAREKKEEPVSPSRPQP